MHTRRFGAFLVGAWLLGSVLVWFVTSQSLQTVDRTLTSPPPAIQKELLDDLGPELSRQILLYDASQLNRRVTETWEILQLGLAAALLAISFLTSSRSKTIVIAALLMTLTSAVMALYLTPSMNALARSFDFLPQNAALGERAAFQNLQVWHRVLLIVGLLAALVATARLLFDFYEFGAKLIPDLGKNTNKRRRRRRTPGDSAAAPADGSSPQS
jgi:hypothetical protein